MRRLVMSALLVRLESTGEVLPPASWDRIALPQAIRFLLATSTDVLTTHGEDRLRLLGPPYDARAEFAAVVLAGDADATDRELLNVHACLLRGLAAEVILPEAAPAVCRLIERRWLTMSRMPFRLVAPRLSVPPLLNALGIGEDGPRKAALIVRAGAFALGASVPRWLADVMRTLESKA